MNEDNRLQPIPTLTYNQLDACNVSTEVVEILHEVSGIHEVDEYTGKCLAGCIACRAKGLLEKLVKGRPGGMR